jgi:hypothetical protein
VVVTLLSSVSECMCKLDEVSVCMLGSLCVCVCRCVCVCSFFQWSGDEKKKKIENKKKKKRGRFGRGLMLFAFSIGTADLNPRGMKSKASQDTSGTDSKDREARNRK